MTSLGRRYAGRSQSALFCPVHTCHTFFFFVFFFFSFLSGSLTRIILGVILLLFFPGKILFVLWCVLCFQGQPAAGVKCCVAAVKRLTILHHSAFFIFITITRLYKFDPLKPHFYVVKLGFTGVYIIFHISAQSIDCGYSLEPPRRGGFNEYPQSMFWAEIRKILEFFIWKFSFFGRKIFNIFE